MIKRAGRIIRKQLQEIKELRANGISVKALSVQADPTHALKAHYIDALSGVLYL